jgi:hyperosmotically inducible periplasmic protein
MKYRIVALMITVLSLVSVACNETANNNANINRNMANTNVNNSNVVTNENANMNRNDNATATRRAPTREEYEREKDRYAREAKESGRTIGEGINDGWLWVKTRFDLAAADDLRDSTINVDVSNDVVTLTGTVASAAQKTKAEAVAKAVEGVKAVRNQLKVEAAKKANT